MTLNLSTRISISIIGVYAGLLGMIHGFFEILQGNIEIQGVLIEAIGSNYQKNFIWQEGLPAMTIIPNFLLTGITSIVISFITFIWFLFLIKQESSRIILIILSFLMFIFGSGFIPPFLCLLTGLFSLNIKKRQDFWQRFLKGRIHSILSKSWIWIIIIYIIWIIGEWIIGIYNSQVLINMRMILFIVKLISPFLILLSAIANDIKFIKVNGDN